MKHIRNARNASWARGVTAAAAVLLSIWLSPAGRAQDAPPAPPVDSKDATPEEEKEEFKITDRPEEEVVAEIEEMWKRVTSRVKGDFPALDQERRRRSVKNLAGLPHPRTVEALKELMTGKYEPYLRGAAAEALGFMRFDRKDVGRFLVSRIQPEWKESEPLIGIALGLGVLGVVPDRDKMYRYFKHKDDEVYVSMIDCLGAMKDEHALPRLAEIFQQFGKVSTSGVNVRVDTGTAGPRDQQQAEARGRGMMQKARAERRDGALHAVQMAIRQITGVKFEYSDKFVEWLKENEERLGLVEPKRGSG